MGAEASRDDIAACEDASGERLATDARCARAHLLHGYAAAARKLLGDDAHERVVRELPEIADSLSRDAEDWIPIEHIASYCEASFVGVDRERLREAARLSVDHGLPSARRLLLAVATPHGLVRRSSEMFRQQFHDGRMVGYTTSPCSAVITIYDHRFNQSALLRDLASEAIRYMLQLTGAADAVEHHDDDVAAPLVVRMTWG